MRIGIDIMGGDLFPASPLLGAVSAQRKLGDSVRLVLIGDEKIIRSGLDEVQASAADFDIVHTDQAVSMTDSPTRSLATKPRSSIALGIGMVKEKKLDGFVSAGNTGAMMVASVMGLGTIPGVLRPTIGVHFPYGDGDISIICDVGANVDCKPEVLAQFGLLGSVYMGAMHGIKTPRVATINIGEEKGKGPQVIKDTYELLESNPKVNFIGNAEGWDFYEGKADVYVCDGYTGNIVLKFGESFYKVLKAKFPKDNFVETYNYENIGGLPLLGVRGIVIIGHGKSGESAFENMIFTAIKAAESQLTQKIEDAFKGMMQNTSPTE